MLGFLVLIGSFHLFLKIHTHTHTHTHIFHIYRWCNLFISNMFKYKLGFTQKTTNVLYTQDEELMLF